MAFVCCSFCFALGVYWGLSSDALPGVWVGMELCSLSVLVLLGFMTTEKDSKPLMQYFMIQGIGSAFFLVFVGMWMGGIYFNYFEYLLVFGMMMKLGLCPFHTWVPSVCSNLKWLGCFLILVPQKFIPFWIFMNRFLVEILPSDGYIPAPAVFGISLILTGFTGCFGGMGVTNFRVLLAYSSMIHTSMMIILAFCNYEAFFYYIFFYFLVNLCLMVSLNSEGIFVMEDLMKSSVNLGWASMYIFSLAGCPPFIGSALKVCFFHYAFYFDVVSCVGLAFCSMVSLFMYVEAISRMMIKISENPVKKVRSSEWNLLMVSIFVNVILGTVMYFWMGIMI